jgi:REP element-mobilizing transposase RayT
MYRVLAGKVTAVPRANRYIVPANIYHLTHRCHDREFLLKFAQDRNGYRERLREAVVGVDLSLLTYNITSNHVHLLAYAERLDQIATCMQQAGGQFARDYNRRKQRRGAYWEGRYHATMIDSGEYLWECLIYVELNMVRCGKVRHPREWAWSGYKELMGIVVAASGQRRGGISPASGGFLAGENRPGPNEARGQMDREHCGGRSELRGTVGRQDEESTAHGSRRRGRRVAATGML